MAQLKIYQEAIKQQHVSHWDFDYMTSAQIESAVLVGKLKSDQGNHDPSHTADPEPRSWWSPCAGRLSSAINRSH